MPGLFIRNIGLKQYKTYKTYKKYLRIDFKKTCGYCLIPETYRGGSRHFDTDHYEPVSRAPQRIFEYINLFYCCKSCNSTKSDKWPTTLEISKGARFFDACSDLPNDHFEIDINGEITAITEIGLFTAFNIELYDVELNRIRKRIITLARNKKINLNWNLPVDDIIDLIEP